MTWPDSVGGIGVRIAVATIGTTALAVAIVTFGVIVVGSDTFTRLMMEHGASVETAHAMFDESISVVLAVAVGAGLLAAVALAVILGRRRGRPLGVSKHRLSIREREDISRVVGESRKVRMATRSTMVDAASTKVGVSDGGRLKMRRT